MAKITLGIGTSHTPMLLTEPENWPKFKDRDEVSDLLDTTGVYRKYQELLDEAPRNIHQQLSPQMIKRRHSRCINNLERLSQIFNQGPPHLVIIIGDDQMELFSRGNLPSLLVYYGENIPLLPRRPVTGEPLWWRKAREQYYAVDKRTDYPVNSELAIHVIEQLIVDGFEVSSSRQTPGQTSEGHAFAFVHSRLFQGCRLPIVPIFINTYFPPNQLRPDRCYDLGEALRRAVERWESDTHVAVLASGGLSHFVIDEELDNLIMEAMRKKDRHVLTSLPLQRLNSGNSEIRNWIVMHAATRHLDVDWLDYIPCYRTEAGTGTGCAFGVWR